MAKTLPAAKRPNTALPVLPLAAQTFGVGWLAYLPATALGNFFKELVEIGRQLEAGADWKLLDQFLFEWRETALVYSDPQLLADLTHPKGGDMGPAPRP